MRLAFICLHGCHTYINLLCPISSEYFLIQLSSSSCFFNFSSCWHCLQHPVYLWFQEYLDQNQDVLPWCINYARSPFLSVQALKESPAILSLSVYLLSCLHLLYSILYHPVAAVKSSSELLFTESIEQVLKYCFFLYVFCLIFFFFFSMGHCDHFLCICTCLSWLSFVTQTGQARQHSVWFHETCQKYLDLLSLLYYWICGLLWEHFLISLNSVFFSLK